MKMALAAALMVSPMLSAVAMSAEFSYDEVLPVYLKLDKSLIVDDLVVSYMEKYRPEVWRKYKDDEFEFKEKKAETLRFMKERIAAANPDVPFTILTNFSFGEYKFETEKFEFSPFSEGLYFSVSYCCNELPRKIDVFFLNPDIVDGIPMPKDAARQFLASRKSQYGDIDRNVTAKFNIIIKEYKGRGKLAAEIQSIELIDRDKKSILNISRGQAQTSK